MPGSLSLGSFLNERHRRFLLRFFFFPLRRQFLNLNNSIGIAQRRVRISASSGISNVNFYRWTIREIIPGAFNSSRHGLTQRIPDLSGCPAAFCFSENQLILSRWINIAGWLLPDLNLLHAIFYVTLQKQSSVLYVVVGVFIGTTRLFAVINVSARTNGPKKGRAAAAVAFVEF